MVSWFIIHYLLAAKILCLILFVTLSFKNRIFRFLIINTAISLLVFEILIALMLVHPSIAKFGPRNFLVKIYMNHYRNVIQLDPKFTRYDPYLKYTFRPGVFFFHNSEFNNKFGVNSLGVRDDESSLSSPDIVVAGDSIPMGWGVNQDETFAKQIEKGSGLKVLDAAVSSYSTVEAMRILEKVDTSKMKFLIIYYEHWKYKENLSFYLLKDKFRILDQKAYEKTVNDYAKDKRYYPGKYLKIALEELSDKLFDILLPMVFKMDTVPSHSADDKSISIQLEAEIFLYTLIHASRVDLNNVKIIILCPKDFIEPLKDAASKEYPTFIKNIIQIEEPAIKEDYGYILDDHPTAKWHRQVAGEILRILNANTKFSDKGT